MATQVQFRRGTTTDIATFTGAEGEVVVDLTKKTCVINDGVQTAGYPLLREDGSNSALLPGSASSCSLKFLNDPNTGIISPGSVQIALVTGGVTRLTVDSFGAITVPGNILISGSLSLGTILAGNGTISNPSISFASDTDTGVARTASNQLSLITAASERLVIDSNGDVELKAQAEFRLADSDSSNYVGFQAPATVTANVVWTLPATDTSTANYALVSDGSGNLSWGRAGGATGGGSDDIFYENGQAVTTNYTLTTNKNAMSAGPVTIDSGVTVTIPAGQAWSIV
jgi:hypothetical protein